MRFGSGISALRGCSLALLLLGVEARAQTSSFALIGHIESFTLTTPTGPTSAATLTLRGIPVLLPANLLVTMPGRYMTPQDLFRGPRGGAQVQSRSGLALADPTPPRVPFEAEVIGNISNGRYVAGVVRISQGALHIGAGFIQAIDPASGELRIGDRGGTAGARVRLNDPTGIYGVANNEGAKAGIPLDERFALDPDNSPVHARTGFPVCVPRSGNDAKCPAGNRPAGMMRFTCARETGGVLTPAASADAPARACDPGRPVPLAVGDYVTFVGMLQADPTGGFLVAAHGLEAELGIYTSPGTEPVYLFVEEALQGTKGEPFPDVPQEETTRFRIVGFTTDPTRNVEVRLVDTGRNEEGTSFSGPDGIPPSNGPQLGRFRNTWPAKDDARAVRRDVLARVVGSPNAKLATGLTSGLYVAPVGEYIYPEVTRFGVPGFPVSVPFENFCFLANGGGSFATAGGTVAIGRLDPFPDSGHAQSQPVGNGSQRACDGQ
ncbi:hypothetical protein [Paracraurococcus lichenis]|uniref:DUF5666 domain-containing protein n=1 Tax=Paracraurococcus lichenis TaxID=3064888 RepID=A0ABT9EC25_9PROT|nr:hypothetical protein [Paracraurococcus sp. LOR1-02]MDO9713445.1 hypothetical protein [Paracraurococcus sp. LOR1-02]